MWSLVVNASDKVLVEWDDGIISSNLSGVQILVNQKAFRGEEMIPTPTSSPIPANLLDPEWCALATLDVLDLLMREDFWESEKVWSNDPISESEEDIEGLIL